MKGKQRNQKDTGHSGQDPKKRTEKVPVIFRTTSFGQMQNNGAEKERDNGGKEHNISLDLPVGKDQQEKRA